MGQWLADLSLGHIKLLSTKLFWKKNPFFTQFLAKFLSIFFSNYYFFIFCNFKKSFSFDLPYKATSLHNFVHPNFFWVAKNKKYINKIIIWKNFERNFARNCVKNGFFLQNNSVENSLICPKNKSASHCPTELFPIYPNIHWTMRRRDDHIIVPSSNRIKLKIDWF